MSQKTKTIALGGLLAAVALVIMCMGGLIPIATYVCPILCCVLQYIVFIICGKRIAWTWYAVVSLLCLLLAPDKEAAALFVLLGYYPMIKPIFEKWPLSWLWKLLLFNGAIAALYMLLMRLMGLVDLMKEFASVGIIGLVLMLVMGNVTFFLLDKLLSIAQRKWRKR